MRAVLLLLLAISGTPSTEGYFPAGAFHEDWPRLDEITQKWYSQQLKALNEPSLFASRNNGQAEIYRFLWLRTWDHPIAIRIEITKDSAKVVVKEADGSGGDKPGKLIRNTELNLSANEKLRFLKALEDVGFWSEPTVESSSGRDGARWIFEGVKEGSYHVVDRWSPPIRKKNISTLGKTFIALAKLQLKDEEIY